MSWNRGRTLKVLGATCALAFVAALAVAQSAGVETETVNVSGRLSWQEIVSNGGVIIYILGGMSVLMLACVIYFVVVLRPGQVAPRPLLRELLEKIGGGALDEARHACEYKPCPLSSVTLAALNHAGSLGDMDNMLLKDIMEGEGARQAESIQGQTQYLMDIAVVAPMLGLLGTVFGMLRAFSAVALNIDKAKPVVLAAGVSEALVTTAFGLMVGIPAMVFYAIFRRQASNMASCLESASTEVMAALFSKRTR